MKPKQLEARLFDILLKPLGMLARFFRTDYSIDGDAITVTHPFRKSVSIRIEEFDEVGVETTDQGPFVEDVFWILKRGQMRLRIGEPHPIFPLLMERFRSLEGFDWKPFIEAMSCSENCYFLCWRRVRLTDHPITKP